MQEAQAGGTPFLGLLLHSKVGLLAHRRALLHLQACGARAGGPKVHALVTAVRYILGENKESLP